MMLSGSGFIFTKTEAECLGCGKSPFMNIVPHMNRQYPSQILLFLLNTNGLT